MSQRVFEWLSSHQDTKKIECGQIIDERIGYIQGNVTLQITTMVILEWSEQVE